MLLDGPVSSVALGWDHTCAVLEGGSVQCWGEGDNHRLGYSDTDDIGDLESPAAAGAGTVELGGPVAAVGCGDTETCALLKSGLVHCWGKDNQHGLGYGNKDTVGNDETPAEAGPVELGATAQALAVGQNHRCIVTDDNGVRCWGKSNLGQLGYGDTETIGDTETPANVGDVEYE